MTVLFDGLAFSETSSARNAITGYGREHWVAVADHLLRASERFQSSSPWLYQYPGNQSINGAETDGLEGFARTLLLGSFRLASGPGHENSRWSSQLLEGLASGAEALTQRADDAWIPIQPSSQSLVEAASIATSLAVCREHLWDPLPQNARDALAQWLRQALVPQTHLNNWVLFPAIVAASLRSLGYESQPISSTLTTLPGLIEKWSLASGWYSDGPGTRIDYYNAWAFHYYLPLIAHLSGDKEITELAKSRVGEFLRSFSLFFSPTGAPIYFGRSLTYRFGSVAPMWSAQLLGDTTVEPGVLRTKASEVLRYFIMNDAMAEGCLSVGWHGRNDFLRQEYSSAASPLWSAKAFVGLLLSPTHPAWAMPESHSHESPPSSSVQLSSSAGFLVDNSATTRVAKLNVAGISKWPSWSPQSRLRDSLYDRMAYSSVTAPYSGTDVPENTLFVSSGSTTTRPAAAHLVRTGENWISSKSRLWGSTSRKFPPTYRWGKVTKLVERAFAPEPWRQATLSTLTVIRDDVEIRIYSVSGVPAQSEVNVGWFAIADAHATFKEEDPSHLILRGEQCAQAVRLLSPGWSLTAESRLDKSNPFGEELKIPTASTTVDSRGNAILGVVLRLSCVTDAEHHLMNFDLTQNKDSLLLTHSASGEWLTVGLGQKLLHPTRWNSAETRRLPF